MLKMKKELEEFFRRKSDASAADLADLDQRFTLVEERLRLYDEKMPGAARGATEVAEASLCQLEDVLQEVDVMKRCLEELAQRFGQARLPPEASSQLPPQLAATSECRARRSPPRPRPKAPTCRVPNDRPRQWPAL
ncbi:unnamed protein product [Durusdinium trenchii]|uniref:Tubulin-specific chaperone A n=1 Tax=Durusdinium trenchii TaxID=1381693 RepID=A0ABP0ITR2_9DINO